MSLLLDTCTFLWWAADDPAVPENVRTRLRDPDQQVYLSSVSVWEVCVKHALGKLPLPIAASDYVPDRRRQLGIVALSLEESDVIFLPKLPLLHRDPFDRMLVSHAIARGSPSSPRILWCKRTRATPGGGDATRSATMRRNARSRRRGLFDHDAWNTHLS